MMVCEGDVVNNNEKVSASTDIKTARYWLPYGQPTLSETGQSVESAPIAFGRSFSFSLAGSVSDVEPLCDNTKAVCMTTRPKTIFYG